MKQDVSSPIVTVRGVSPETRAMANHAARGQEIPLGEWLSEAIHQYAGMSKKSDPKEQIVEQLSTFGGHIQRLEKLVRGTILPRRTSTDVDLQDLLSAYAEVLNRKR